MSSYTTSEKIIELCRHAGFTVPKDEAVLDLGCVAGNLVREFLDEGYDCHGCDIAFKEGPHQETLKDQGRIKEIQIDPYQLPYEDKTFACAFSNQVFEHVQDYDSTLTELYRVLQPGGFAFHTFPSKWRLFERHTGTPLGGALKKPAWIRLWAYLGLNRRNPQACSRREVAERDIEYLLTRTNYLSGREIEKVFQRNGFSIQYVNQKAMSFSSFKLARAFARIPGAGWLSQIFQARFIVCQRR